MLAKQLSYVLTELCSGSDVGADSFKEMDQRFESLRNYGKLPRGRENRGIQLSDEQITFAILGLVASKPSWAGHVVTVIADLKPVGGQQKFFGDSVNITETLSYILKHQEVRASIIAVKLSVAETGTNSHGLVVITYECHGKRNTYSFVRNEAVTLLQPGAELDTDKRNSPVSRELVLNQRFFNLLVAKIETSRAMPKLQIGDGSEYDKEDEENARRIRLGVHSSSCYLNIGVDNQVDWPREELLVDFDSYKLVLMPKTAENIQSVHIDLRSNNLSMEEARTVINRFLSWLTWCDDQYAILQDGWAGNPIPVPVPKPNLAFTVTNNWLFNRTIPTSDNVRRALALYREGRNAEQNYMISYGVLSYFKILEIRYSEGKKIQPWIARCFPLIQNELNERLLDKFLQASREEGVDKYLWNACRVAVAHTREKHPSDPDDAQELQRLDIAATIMRRLARHFIKTELNVSDSPYEDTSLETSTGEEIASLADEPASH